MKNLHVNLLLYTLIITFAGCTSTEDVAVELAEKEIAEKMEIPSIAKFSGVITKEPILDQRGREMLAVCGNVTGKIRDDTGADTRRFLVELWIKKEKTIQVWNSAIDVEGGNALAFNGFQTYWNKYCSLENSTKKS